MYFTNNMSYYENKVRMCQIMRFLFLVFKTYFNYNKLDEKMRKGCSYEKNSIWYRFSA